MTNGSTKRRQTRQASSLGPLRKAAENRLRLAARRGCELAVNAGLPPPYVGYRHVRTESARDHVARMRTHGNERASFEVVHPAAAVSNPLPINVPDRRSLPDDVGWWGYSMQDVPERMSSETFIAKIPGGQVVSYIDERNEFYPAILTRDNRAINLREIVFRNLHAEVLRASPPVRKLSRATWICERVYDNHSHWLTAHLPKLNLLRECGALGDVLLPERLSPAMEVSIRLMGLDPAAFARFAPGELLQIDALTILGTDRFRGELLRPVRDAIAPAANHQPTRRIFISRGKAAMRRLVNEDEIWPRFADAGFERVYMEDLDFAAQVRLMSETAVLAAPHGAGLTNMMFCPAGAHIMEIAWLGFPNPNFYALASAMGHRYALVAAQPCGEADMLLERDMVVDAGDVCAALAALDSSLAAAPAQVGT